MEKIMFKKKKVPLRISYLANTSTTSTQITENELKYYPRTFTSNDVIEIQNNSVNILTLDSHNYQRSVFREIFYKAAEQVHNHAISLSQKSKVDIYVSPEIANSITDIVVSSTTTKLFSYSPSDAKNVTIIDDIQMIHLQTASVSEMFDTSLFHTKINYNAKFLENNKAYVPFSINMIKYKAQYKVINNRLLIYLS